MPPQLILALINSGLSMVEALAPEVAKLFQSGQITPEQQQALYDRIEAIRNGSAFSGSEWTSPETAAVVKPSGEAAGSPAAN
jgi:hypothetical protein